jgi:transcriptional regulator with XRE-family HTH domain
MHSDVMPPRIGDRIRVKRLDLRLSYNDLSRLSGVNRNLISQIERGMVPASAAPLEQIAKTLGIE